MPGKMKLLNRVFCITATTIAILTCIVLALNFTRATSVSFPSRKAWWSKRISDDLHTAGRLSERQIKYARETGFKSIISICDYPQSLGFGDGDRLPSSQRSLEVAAIAGITFRVLPFSVADHPTVAVLDYFTEVADSLMKPILVTGTNAGYYATLYTLLYLVQKSKTQILNPEFTVTDIVEIGHAHGYDFTQQPASDLIAMTTGKDVAMKTLDTMTPESWETYWMAKPIASDWFIAGQIYREHLSVIEAAGFKSIINMRKGVKVQPSGDPSQEEVTLLNVHDRTGTYTDVGRQNSQRLLQTRIDASKPNTYISDTSPVNYEDRNIGEFGDDIGFNEVVEKEYIRSNTGLKYYHLPVGGQYGYSIESFITFKSTFLEAVEHGPVLVHCRTGHRASVFTLIIVGYLNCKDSTWAINKAHKLGYIFTQSGTPPQYNLIKDILDEHPNPTCASETSTAAIPMTTLLSPIGVNRGGVLMANMLAAILSVLVVLVM